MTFLVDLSLLGWIPAVLAAFILLPPRKAVLIAFIVGWMFLPVGRGFHIPSFVAYDKRSAVLFASLTGLVATDLQRLRRFRPLAADLPMALFCLLPAVSTLIHGYGFSAAVFYFLDAAVTWGGPYLIGRLYFADREGLQALALAIFIGGLISMPLCLYEIRMSPQLHMMVYGYQPHQFAQSLRGGGYRPMLFMEGGLMVALWMAVSSLLGYAVLVSKGVKSVLQAPALPIVLALFTTTVLCKSTGALALLLLAVMAFEVAKRTGSKALLWFLLAFPIVYVASRIFGYWSGEGLVDQAAMVSTERAGSLLFRIEAENDLIRAVGDQMGFGRGPVGFNEVATDYGSRTVVTDSLWIIIYSRWGWLALISMFAAFMWPIYAQLRSIPARLCLSKQHVCATALAVALAMFLADCVFNAMINPVYLLIMGGLTGYEAARRVSINPASNE